MNPTEELRAKLDELGIEHYDHENGEPLRDLSEAGADPATSWRMGSASVCAVPNKYGTFDLWIDNCTPEQAIAATVGERNPDGLPIGLTVSNDGNLLNWVGENYVRQDAATVGRGNLTAEQVREAIMSADRWRKPMGDTGMTNTHLIIRDDGWQAIADELNATVGAGTCHMRLAYEEEDADGCIWPDHYECDACGAKVNGIIPFYDTEIPPRFCPNCGKKVVSE